MTPEPGLTDRLSAVAFRLRTFYNKTPVGSGTGFFFRAPDNSLFLVTNYHILSGRDPVTSQCLHDHGAIPNLVEFFAPLPVVVGDHKALRLTKKTVPLCDEDMTPYWYTHPIFGQTVDVVCLPVPFNNPLDYWTINDASKDHLFDTFRLTPGLDVFILGFPMGIGVEMHLAIWKRGTIASEPQLDINGKPMFLIDTATRSGMSGAPVIAQIHGVWGGRSQIELTNDTKIGTGRAFVGVYSGRLGADEFKAQLGIVWRHEVITDIINAPVRSEAYLDAFCKGPSHRCGGAIRGPGGQPKGRSAPKNIGLCRSLQGTR